MAAMPNVRDNTALSRFELDADGATAFLNYRIDGGTITLLHTETPVALRGRGIATRLVEGVLEDIRARGLKMVPRCAFVRAFLAKHPEFHDLVS
jgi:predicted GNAT family acetyltransferase